MHGHGRKSTTRRIVFFNSISERHGAEIPCTVAPSISTRSVRDRTPVARSASRPVCTPTTQQQLGGGCKAHACAKKNSWTKLIHLTIDHHLHCELLAPTDTPLAELHYLHIYAAALVMTSQWNIRETYREQLLLAALEIFMGLFGW